MIRQAALCLWVLATQAGANDLQTDFSEMVTRHGIAPAALTVLSPSGEVFFQHAMDQDITDPAPILSISKSFAGACALHLAAEGKLKLTDQVADHLGWTEEAGTVTIAQLLTHTSGYRPDRTQRDILGRFLRKPEKITEYVQRRRVTPNKATDYFYNNENYIVLEAVLNAILDEEAMTWCADNTPGLAGLNSLKTAPVYPAIGLAGGYAASTSDLAQFMRGLAVTDDWPMAPVDDGITYGPGIVLVETDLGTRLIHRGGMCLLTRRGHGAVASRDSLGWVVAFTYTGCPSKAAEGDLQTMLVKAIAP